MSAEHRRRARSFGGDVFPVLLLIHCRLTIVDCKARHRLAFSQPAFGGGETQWNEARILRADMLTNSETQSIIKPSMVAKRDNAAKCQLFDMLSKIST